MKLVVDANILFSLLIKEGINKNIVSNLLFDFYTPSFIIEEFEKHEEEIINKSHRTKEDFMRLFEEMKEVIKIVDSEQLINYIDEAEQISPDPNDVIYFALALKLNCPIWSNDKKLKDQNKIKVYSTGDILKILQQ
ncbi:MAG: PIN domain-containing protein [Nanoarchaeota archaeon]